MNHQAEQVAITTLKTFKGNPRTHNLDALRESLRVNGQYRPVVVRRKTREVLAGNGTMEAALAEGWDQLWATFVDVDAKAAKRIVLVDNRSNDLGAYDDQALAALLQSLPDLEATGYDDKFLDGLLAEMDGPERDASEVEIPAAFDVLITCKSELQQVELIERLSEEGFECRALLS